MSFSEYLDEELCVIVHYIEREVSGYDNII